jgi:hypothetical protein
MFIPWPPSPCTRLSRAQTTMEPPTPICFIGGLLTSAYEPPTFTKMHSTRSFRWQFTSDPSRSLRNPDREQGKPDSLFLPLSWLLCLTSLGPPFGYGRCPVSARVPISRLCKILRGRGKVSRRSNPASRALTMRSLSQARHLGGLHRTAPDLLGAAISPPACIHRMLRPKGSSPIWYKLWSFPLIASLRLVAHHSCLTSCDALRAHCDTA